MDLLRLKNACLRHKDSAPAYFVDPIPEKKANNARESLHIPLAEHIYALIDLTIFGSAKNAMVVTDNGLYWKDDNDKYPFFIAWSKLRHCSLTETQGTHAKNIKFSDGLQMSLLGSGSLGEDNNRVVLHLLKDLKTLSKGELDSRQPCETSDRLDLMLLWDVCNHYRGSASEYYLDPIPEKKVKNARESLHIPPAEHIVALIDFTAFGSAKNAMVVTGIGLYWKNGLDQTTQYLSWPELHQYTPCEEPFLTIKSIVFNDSSKMVFNDNLKMSLNGASTLAQKDNHVVLELLNAIKALLAGDEATDIQVSTTSDRSENGFVECEFCQGKIKPEVTYCKHCGIKLRG